MKSTWLRIFVVFLVVVVLPVAAADAYQRYSPDCKACHGEFDGNTSPKGTVFPGGDKHTMHHGPSFMAATCNLCHVKIGDNAQIGVSAGTSNNSGLGCTGCHGRNGDMGFDVLSPGRGAGLRQHHWNAGVTSCGGCHTDADPASYTPVGEAELPPYYGTSDTKVDEPCNLTATTNLNENWSIGDFEGSDNDGDGLIDGLDPDCQTLGTTTTTTIATTTTSTTSTTLAAGKPCSQPISNGQNPTATDCLNILKAAVGNGAALAACAPQCICIPTGGTRITATDALLCLKKAVGQGVALNCPC